MAFGTMLPKTDRSESTKNTQCDRREREGKQGKVDTFLINRKS